MNETEFQDALKMVLQELSAFDDEYHFETDMLLALARIDRIDTFQEAGVLTRNAGLVVRLTDGSEFQITIVKSK